MPREQLKDVQETLGRFHGTGVVSNTRHVSALLLHLAESAPATASQWLQKPSRIRDLALAIWTKGTCVRRPVPNRVTRRAPRFARVRVSTHERHHAIWARHGRRCSRANVRSSWAARPRAGGATRERPLRSRWASEGRWPGRTPLRGTRARPGPGACRLRANDRVEAVSAASSTWLPQGTDNRGRPTAGGRTAAWPRKRQCWHDRVLGIQDDGVVRCAVGGVPVSSMQRLCR
jgi:hypothetical protein